MTSVSSYTARNLSFKQLEAWSAVGADHKSELQRIVTEIRRSLHHSSSPSKSINVAVKKLESLFSKNEVRGGVQLLNNRHINFRLAFPTMKDDVLIFCLLYGEINSRTGATIFDLKSPIQMSLHALQRIYERLENISDSSVLDEIYSCMGQAIHWHKGATEIEAKSWPLISNNGFFICTGQPSSLTTNLVTWIKGGHIGKKWGLPFKNLLRLKQAHPERLEDSEFAQEFVRSFPWMLYEHVPGEDFIALAWEQREADKDELIHDESDLVDKLENEEIEISNTTQKLSVSYGAGMNYKNDPPPFKPHTVHTGLVVQKRGEGHLIVGLRNGWVGQIHRFVIERGAQLINGYVSPEIGDEVVVVVHKITHFPIERAYSLSLDIKEISDANWAKIEEEHPIGSLLSATLLKKYNQEYIAQINNGIHGVISSLEVQCYFNQPSLFGCSPVGQVLDVSIAGYLSEKKCLLLSIQNIETISNTPSNSCTYKSGEYVHGKCIRNSSNYALIQISQSAYGLLHKLNSWGQELPEVGEDVRSIVIGADSSHVLLGAIPQRVLEKTFCAHSASNEKWDDFISNHAEGDAVEVQTLFWQESIKCYFLVTSQGVVGTMQPTEVDWLSVSLNEQKHLLNPGDIFNAKILKINQIKRRVLFSKKAFGKHPIDEHFSKIDLKAPLQGVVVNVLEYGCFVQLQPYGIQALLHRTNIPDGMTYSKGDHLVVYIDTVDQVKRRVTIKLLSS